MQNACIVEYFISKKIMLLNIIWLHSRLGAELFCHMWQYTNESQKRDVYLIH